MLVLSRFVDEKILIGESIVVTIVSVHGGKVRVGIDAPADVVVHRAEVAERIARERDGPPPPGDSRGAGRSGDNE